MRQGRNTRRSGARGLTLIEVMVSIAVVTAVILAAIGTRYLVVKQAVRADAYNTAGKLGQMLLEGWRGAGDPATYNPKTRFAGQMTIDDSIPISMAPPVPSGLVPLSSTCRYHVELDRVHYYVTLAYKNEDVIQQQPAVLHATVGFQHNYQAASVATSGNYVRLTTYK